MTISSPYSIPYDSTAADMPPKYLDNIPMTASRQLRPDFQDEAMPYRPRERSMEKAFRQLCCGSCWGFCAWIAGILVLLTGIIIVAVVLVSNSKHTAAATTPVPSSTSPAQLSSTTSPVTSLITITTSSQQPSISISTSTVSQLQPSTITDTESQITTSTLTTTQKTTTTSTVSPPQIQTVTQSLSGSLTTFTTMSVSTASASSTSRLTKLLQTINAPPIQQLPLSPPCFESFINDVTPGLYTGQSWTTVGTYEFVSTADDVSTRAALVTDTGVALGATTTLWPLCGKYTVSTFSVPPTAVPPATFPTVTITSIIITTPKVLAPITRTLSPTYTTTILPAPSHANLAVSSRQAPDAIPSVVGGHSKSAITSLPSDKAIPVTYIQTLNFGTTRRTGAITYTPDVLPYTSMPDWPTKIQKDDTAGRHTPNTVSSVRGGQSTPANTRPASSTAIPVTYIQTLKLKATTRTETMTYTRGIHPFSSVPNWQRTSKREIFPQSVPISSTDSNTESAATAPQPSVSVGSALICALEPYLCTTLLTRTTLTSLQVGPPITASAPDSQRSTPSAITALGTESLPLIFSRISTSTTQSLPALGTEPLASTSSRPATSTTTTTTTALPIPQRTAQQMPNRALTSRQKQNKHMNDLTKRTMNPGIIVGIALASLIVVIAAIGLANRWFRHGYL